jgi:hypothetical protein
MENYKHIAYNLTTGEVIMTNTGNHLKRKVRECNRWAIHYGYPVGEWRFAHGGKMPRT